LLPCVHEDEDVVGADGENNIDSKDLGRKRNGIERR
jgi:hypothetical protein